MRQNEGRYELTPFGAQMLLTITCIAQQYVQDRGGEGLKILGEWADQKEG